MIKKDFCNCIAWEKGLDPLGTASKVTRMVALERSLPWKRNIFEFLPDYFEMTLAYAKSIQQEGQSVLSVMGLSQLQLIAPQESQKVNGAKRIILWERPAGAFCRFTRQEYLLPDWITRDFCWAMAFEPEKLSQFANFQINKNRSIRDFLVCTHGARDSACGKFGYKLFAQLSQIASQHPNMEVWRTSHFGGHVYAPTMIEMPFGLYWGNLQDTDAQKIVNRMGCPADIKSNLRGWSGAERGFAQAADGEILKQNGWLWLHEPRQITVIDQEESDQPLWATVRVSTPYEAIDLRVYISHFVETVASTNGSKTKSYPQYRVMEVGRTRLIEPTHQLEEMG